MATISVSSKSYIRPYNNVRTMQLKEEASQTYKLGAILIVDATTKDEVEEAGTDAVAGIAGIALADATGTADTPALFALAEPGAEFVGHIEASATLTDAMLGTDYGTVYDSSNAIWRVDTSDTTNKSVTITGFVDEVGDVNARVRFQFMAAARGIFKG
jgi:hypothetical protein